MKKYEKVLYPKWKYHPEKKAVIVQGEDEEKSLGDGWFDSPAEFLSKKSEAKSSDAVDSKPKVIRRKKKTLFDIEEE